MLNWGGGMNLGLNGDLAWNIGIDSSYVSEIAQLPGELKANVANKNVLKSFITIPDYAYEVGRFEITASGKDGSDCRWHIEEPDLQKMTTVQFAVVFKVPKGTETLTLRGIAWAEPSMNWLTANLKNVFRDLQDKLQNLLRRRDEVADKFARGAVEEWVLTLRA